MILTQRLFFILTVAVGIWFTQQSAASSADGMPLKPQADITRLIASGGNHTCRTTVAATVECWGNNELQQVGDTSRVDRLRPTAVKMIHETVTDLDVGLQHTCTVVDTGAIRCWGDLFWGQVGSFGSSTTASVVQIWPEKFVSVSAGDIHSCGVTENGAVYCWGNNFYGQLGLGYTSFSEVPTAVSSLTSGVKSIVAFGWSTCALMEGGSVKCWGSNQYGQLGINSTVESQLLPRDVVQLEDTVVEIVGSNQHICAIYNNSRVACWGQNAFGQLGDGATMTRRAPVTVSNIENVTALATGGQHTCAVIGLATYCWGSNERGQLGMLGVAFTSTPLRVSELPIAPTGLALGLAHSCAIDASAETYCWGNNLSGEVGIGQSTVRFTPVDTPRLRQDTQQVDSAYQYNCAVDAKQTVLCWGLLGSIFSEHHQVHTSPTPVEGLDRPIEKVAVGNDHACAIDMDGNVLCWGSGANGQLGNGVNTFQPAAVSVVGIPEPVEQIIAGVTFTCAQTESRAVYCWGLGRVSGNGDNGTVYIPQRVINLPDNIIDLSAGNGHACAVTASGETYCWGSGLYGALGNGSNQDQYLPILVARGVHDAVAVSSGGARSCVLTVQGTIECWGGMNTSDWTPQPISDIPEPLISLSNGDRMACGLTAEHAAYCWSWYLNATPLFDGNPRVVAGLASNVQSIHVADQHLCALVDGGGVKCWGENEYYELGIDSPGIIPLPLNIAGSYPEVEFNYVAGESGSFVTVTGHHAVPEQQIAVEVDGIPLTARETVMTDQLGTFLFFIDTADAGNGKYTLSITIGEGAMQQTLTQPLMIDTQLLKHPQFGGGLTLTFPSGMTSTIPIKSTFVPLVVRY